jgi:hypothetical protein
LGLNLQLRALGVEDGEEVADAAVVSLAGEREGAAGVAVGAGEWCLCCASRYSRTKTFSG